MAHSVQDMLREKVREHTLSAYRLIDGKPTGIGELADYINNELTIDEQISHNLLGLQAFIMGCLDIKEDLAAFQWVASLLRVTPDQLRMTPEDLNASFASTASSVVDQVLLFDLLKLLWTLRSERNTQQLKGSLRKYNIAPPYWEIADKTDAEMMEMIAQVCDQSGHPNADAINAYFQYLPRPVAGRMATPGRRFSARRDTVDSGVDILDYSIDVTNFSQFAVNLFVSARDWINSWVDLDNEIDSCPVASAALASHTTPQEKFHQLLLSVPEGRADVMDWLRGYAPPSEDLDASIEVMPWAQEIDAAYRRMQAGESTTWSTLLSTLIQDGHSRRLVGDDAKNLQILKDSVPEESSHKAAIYAWLDRLYTAAHAEAKPAPGHGASRGGSSETGALVLQINAHIRRPPGRVVGEQPRARAQRKVAQLAKPSSTYTDDRGKALPSLGPEHVLVKYLQKGPSARFDPAMSLMSLSTTPMDLDSIWALRRRVNHNMQAVKAALPAHHVGRCRRSDGLSVLIRTLQAAGELPQLFDVLDHNTALQLKLHDERYAMAVGGAGGPILAYMRLQNESHGRFWGSIVALGAVGGFIIYAGVKLVPGIPAFSDRIGPWSPVDSTAYATVFAGVGLSAEAVEILLESLFHLTRAKWALTADARGQAADEHLCAKGMKWLGKKAYEVTTSPALHSALMLGAVVIDSFNPAEHFDHTSPSHSDTQQGMQIFNDLLIAGGVSTFMTCMRVAHEASLHGGGVVERFKVYGRGIKAPFKAVASSASDCCSWLSARWDRCWNKPPDGYAPTGSPPSTPGR